MNRGNLVIYDKAGKIFAQTGEMSGDVLPHEYPVGLPYIELEYGAMRYGEQRLVSIDVSAEPHVPVFEVCEHEQTPREQIQQLENELLIAKGVI